jgi:hypothetical protein
MSTINDDVEVVHALLLPFVSQRFDPVGVGILVAADIN